MIFSTENQLKELGDKLPADSSDRVRFAETEGCSQGSGFGNYWCYGRIEYCIQAEVQRCITQARSAQGGAQAGPDMNAGQSGGGQSTVDGTNIFRMRI